MSIESLDFTPNKKNEGGPSVEDILQVNLETPFDDLPKEKQEQIRNWTLGRKINGEQTYH
ncbi:MAG: hypothetical protein K9M10_00940 [Candidatus Pacebacteria bacterium]|nr:hypothetical protein [Candidatus Paceibacterota bacterium]MCF7857029.1 hypothetical protein [Candidatus Paceibacterota bacterium]